MFIYQILYSVEKAYNNQRKLENEAKKLQNHVDLFSKQTQLWINMLENFNQALKELGDVDNWARTIETDITTIASALEYAYKGNFFSFFLEVKIGKLKNKNVLLNLPHCFVLKLCYKLL